MSYLGYEQEIDELKQQMHELMGAIGNVPTSELNQKTEMFLRRNLGFITSGFADAQQFPDEIISKRTGIPINEVPQRWKHIRDISPETLSDQMFMQLKEMSANELKAMIVTIQGQFGGNIKSTLEL